MKHMALYNFNSSMKRSHEGSHSIVSQQPLLLLGLPLNYRTHLPWIRAVCQHQELQRGPEYAHRCEGWPCRAGGLLTACRLNGCPLPVPSQILWPSLRFLVSPARLFHCKSFLVTALKLCLENPPGSWPQIRLATVTCKWPPTQI